MLPVYYFVVVHFGQKTGFTESCAFIFLEPSFCSIWKSEPIKLYSDFQAERDGSNEYSNYQPGSLNTTDQLIKDLKNIDIVFHIGDITYANGYISQWDQFTAQVEPIASTVPYMIARFVSSTMLCVIKLHPLLFIYFFFYEIWTPCSGNHERDCPGTGSFYEGNDSGGECGVLAQTMFYVPADNRAKFW